MKHAIILAAILLAGCTSIPGVQVTEDERKACAILADAPPEQQCSVWSIPELQRLAREFFMRGYQAGKSSL